MGQRYDFDIDTIGADGSATGSASRDGVAESLITLAVAYGAGQPVGTVTNLIFVADTGEEFDLVTITGNTDTIVNLGMELVGADGAGLGLYAPPHIRGTLKVSVSDANAATRAVRAWLMGI